MKKSEARKLLIGLTCVVCMKRSRIRDYIGKWPSALRVNDNYCHAFHACSHECSDRMTPEQRAISEARPPQFASSQMFCIQCHQPFATLKQAIEADCPMSKGGHSVYNSGYASPSMLWTQKPA